jgi:hypothetical protein
MNANWKRLAIEAAVLVFSRAQKSYGEFSKLFQNALDSLPSKIFNRAHHQQ